MDFAKLDTVKEAETGASLQVKNPVTGEILETDGQPVTIQLIGSDSDTCREVTRRAANRRLAAMSGNQRGPAGKVTVEQVEQDALDILVSCTKGWSGIVVDGNPLQFSSDAARALYKRFPWLKEQVDGFINDRANFLGN